VSILLFGDHSLGIGINHILLSQLVPRRNYFDDNTTRYIKAFSFFKLIKSNILQESTH